MEMKNNNNNINAIVACELCDGNCWGCMYADACAVWCDTGSSRPIVYNGHVVGYAGKNGNPIREGIIHA